MQLGEQSVGTLCSSDRRLTNKQCREFRECKPAGGKTQTFWACLLANDCGAVVGTDVGKGRTLWLTPWTPALGGCSRPFA